MLRATIEEFTMMQMRKPVYLFCIPRVVMCVTAKLMDQIFLILQFYLIQPNLWTTSFKIHLKRQQMTNRTFSLSMIMVKKKINSLRIMKRILKRMFWRHRSLFQNLILFPWMLTHLMKSMEMRKTLILVLTN